MPRILTAFAALAISAALAGCASSVSDAFDSRQNVGPCPPAGSLYESSRIVEFQGEGSNFGDITYTGEITGVELFCRYAGADPLVAQINLDFAFGQGPQGMSDTHVYSYWVMVTRRNGAVLARESFSVEADFSDGPVDAVSDTLRDIVIPRLDETISGVNFEILVGFELTESQLAFNRAGQRFRLDAGADQ